jgi:hypothetical protein
LGVLMPEARDGMQRLSKKSTPVRHALCLSRFPRKRGAWEGWGHPVARPAPAAKLVHLPLITREAMIVGVGARHCRAPTDDRDRTACRAPTDDRDRTAQRRCRRSLAPRLRTAACAGRSHAETQRAQRDGAGGARRASPAHCPIVLSLLDTNVLLSPSNRVRYTSAQRMPETHVLCELCAAAVKYT